jgi:hypothetical protein
MEQQSNNVRFSRWHGLMCSTGILLIICGVPATILLAFIFSRDNGPAHLDRSEALIFALCAVAAELLLAGILLFVAKRITKRRSRILTTKN